MRFELCAATIEAIKVAREFTFDRIELCKNLEQGGTTPSNGMIEYAIECGIETHVLIRPRPGNFSYDESEHEVILRDVLNCKEMGANGVVIGALNSAGEIDRYFLNNIMKKSNGMEVTFHRAFDDSIHWKQSLDLLIEHGVHRVLSSGMASNAEIGIPILRQMVDYSASRIQIMAGGGVNAANISKIMNEVKPDAMHFSGTSKFQMDEDSLFSDTILKVERNKVNRILVAAAK